MTVFERPKITTNTPKNYLLPNLTDLYHQGKRKAIIYGTNQLAEITYLSLLDSSIKLYSILTDDPSKKKFLGQQVLTLSEFTQEYSENLSYKNLILLCTTDTDKEKLSKEISKYKNIKNNLKIIYIDDILKTSI